MSKNNDRTIEYEKLEVGKPYVVTLTSGAVLSGILSSKREDLSNGSVVREYEIMFDNATHVYLHECQIVNIREIKVDDTEGYFKKFENEYDVRCFDNDGELLPVSRILYNVFSKKRIWGRMKKKERKRLIQHIYFTDEDIFDLIDVFLIQKEENERLHNDKLKVLDATSELVEKYNKIRDKCLYSEGMYDLLFKELGLEKFINKIC